MFFEYALEPDLAALCCGDAAMYHACKSSFGIKTQRIISRYPDHWSKLYLDAFNKIFPAPSLQQKKARDDLHSHITKRSVKRKMAYLPHETWSNNASSIASYFLLILVNSNPSENLKLTTIASVSEWYEKLPEHDGHKKVRRRSEDISAELRPLMLSARHIVLIDPYFNAVRNHFVETFKALLDIVASRPDKSLVTVELHTGIEREFKKPKIMRDEQIEKRCASEIIEEIEKRRKYLIPAGINLRMVVWQEWKPEVRKKCEELHNRYIFTDIGGILMGHGSDEETWDRESTDDFVCLTSEGNYQERWNDYLGSQPVFEKLQDKRLL